jgi:hypothetical protein
VVEMRGILPPTLALPQELAVIAMGRLGPMMTGRTTHHAIFCVQAKFHLAPILSPVPDFPALGMLVWAPLNRRGAGGGSASARAGVERPSPPKSADEGISGLSIVSECAGAGVR